MRDASWIRRLRLHVALAAAFLSLGFGASQVFSQAPGPAATPSDDPERSILLLQKSALEAEIKAAEGRLIQAEHRRKNARVGNRAGVQPDDFLLNADVDIAERRAVIARKRVELKEITNQLEGPAGSDPRNASLANSPDDLLRRIKDLEARVDRIEASGREFRLRTPGAGNRSLFLD